ncbi:hypothetical protein RKD32_003996 [Streptomyces sp. SAI-195]|uniref:hypothetical protein n=1 Tax=Streptomyces sp. SAI-195 TaxID=3377734 RepID=UPI003C7C52D6
MTLDAQDWVWRHSRSRGNSRLALLAIADATTGPAALARVGTADLARRLNASKGAAVEAVRRALDSGELEIAEAAAGSRAALYRIPGAVDYVRRSGPETRPETQRSGNPTTTGLRSGNPTTNAPDSGPETRPQDEHAEPPLWSGNPTGSGRESDPHHSPIERVNEGGREYTRGDVAVIPVKARPLVDQITAAGVVVAWTLAPAEWFMVEALMKRSGADMLATAAVQAAARNRKGISHARYFLRAWQSLPPAPEPGTVPAAAPTGPGADVIPLDPTAPRKGRAAQSADYLAAALARMEAQQ